MLKAPSLNVSILHMSIPLFWILEHLVWITTYFNQHTIFMLVDGRYGMGKSKTNRGGPFSAFQK